MILWDRIDADTRKALKGGLAYLATPYSAYAGGRHKAFKAAATIAGELHIRRIDVFSAITHAHPMVLFGFAEPDDTGAWTRLNAHFIGICDRLLIARMIGWNSSKGVREERAAFKRMGKPEFFIDVEGA